MVRRVFAGPLLLLLTGVSAPAQHAIEVHHDLEYAAGIARDGRRNSLDLYLPDGVQRPPLVMFVHGGGWAAGSKERYPPLGEALAAEGLACAIINTRMFPFVRPDKMVEDCARAIGWLHANAAAHDYDGDRLFLMGHSAGAHLVSWLALDATMWRIAETPRTVLRGVFAMSGVYDARPHHQLLERVFGDDVALRAAASPARYVSAAAPPFCVLWAENDIPGLALGSRMLVHRLRRHGRPVETIELPRKNHVDYVRELRRANPELLPHVIDWIRRTDASPPPGVPAVHREVARHDNVLAARDGLPTDLFLPDARPRQWLVLAVGAEEREAAATLAWQLAREGAAVAVVDCAPLRRLEDDQSVARFTATVRLLADPKADHALPASPPFLGAIGAAGWLVAVAPITPSGRVLLGAPAAAAVTRDVLRGGRRHGQLADRLLRANAAPILVVGSDGDAAAARADSVDLLALIQRRGDVTIQLDDEPVAAMLRGLGPDDDTLVPLLAAFLGL